jgi:hypothetical protein
MDVIFIISLLLLALWTTLKLVRCACFVLSFLIPGGHEAYVFWFEKRQNNDDEEEHMPNIVVRALTCIWRAWCAVWHYLFSKSSRDRS